MGDLTNLPTSYGRAEVDAAGAAMDESDRLAAEALNDTADEDYGEGAGRSIEDLATDDDGEDQAELFPIGALEGDVDLTPAKLLKKGVPVNVTVSIGKAEVPLRGAGLLNPHKMGRALVSYVYQGHNNVAKHDDSSQPGLITGWTIRQSLRATWVEPADDEATLIAKEFAALKALDEPAAGRLLDELKAMFSQD